MNKRVRQNTPTKSIAVHRKTTFQQKKQTPAETQCPITTPTHDANYFITREHLKSKTDHYKLAQPIVT